jgi:2,3-bisphosphoglycerate-independent phosphoglycerate mutase
MTCPERRFVALIILDGWGLASNEDHNAVALADTPAMDRIGATFPSTTLRTCGGSVGLPDGLFGNSEVGHLNLGAGRVVMQAVTRIDDRVKDGGFPRNEALIASMDRVAGTNRRLHLIGLVSDGGVHSWPNHYSGLLKMAAGRRLRPDQVYIHAWLDGRDTPPRSGIRHLAALREMCASAGVGKIATVCGRYFAMDRDRRWDRVRVAYDAMTLGEGIRAEDPLEALRDAYDRNETDEFVKPIVIAGSNADPLATVGNDDSVLCFNFRSDRGRQITRAFVLPGFDGFERTIHPRVHYTCLTRYEAGLPVDAVAFSPKDLAQELPDVCGKTLSEAGLRQLRIAETEKYAHVTYFFNGQREEPFEGEARILVPSPRDVPTYDHKPEMSARAIARKFVDAIRSRSFDTAICNFANPDMVGHTGVLDAAVKAVATVDKCLEQVLAAIGDVGGAAIVTADHGNAEQMIHHGTREPRTAHTANPVPLILVDPAFRGRLRKGGSLCDVAPTFLGMLGLHKPEAMTGEDLRVMN